MCVRYLVSAWIVGLRVRGMASDEVGGGDVSNDDEMRLFSRNQVLSLNSAVLNVCL